MEEPLYQLIQGRRGRFLCNPRDEYIGRSLIAYGEWGDAEVRLFERFLRDGDVVVEVGANIGAHTVPISKAVGATGAVHALEPQRLIHQLLCANLALNDCLNVHARRAAAGNATGTVTICDIPPHWDMNFGAISVGLSYGPKTSMEPVPLLTIDGLDLPRIDLIKVDAEGLDVEVLKGAKTALARHRPALFIEAAPKTLPDLSATLLDLGYDAYWYCSRLFDQENIRANTDYIWSYLNYTLISADILALPRHSNWKVEGLAPVSDQVDWGALPQSVDNFRTDIAVSRP